MAANRFQADKMRLHQTTHQYDVRRCNNLNAKSFREDEWNTKDSVPFSQNPSSWS
jgi:hypothetical protein